jgi:hypothetical protein
VVIFRTGISTIPIWSFLLAKGASRKEGKTDIFIRTSLECITLRLDNEAMRDAWLDKIESVSISLADRIMEAAPAVDPREAKALEWKASATPAKAATVAILPPGSLPPEVYKNVCLNI